jgi:predicted  nucleic acid-binding Zn-ribbon protein
MNEREKAVYDNLEKQKSELNSEVKRAEAWLRKTRKKINVIQEKQNNLLQRKLWGQ